MQKNTTFSNKTDLKIQGKSVVEKYKIEPQQVTLNFILQFAATYRVEKITPNQFVELCLN